MTKTGICVFMYNSVRVREKVYVVSLEEEEEEEDVTLYRKKTNTKLN